LWSISPAWTTRRNVDPEPICPLPLRPHATGDPSCLIANVWLWPLAIFVALVRDQTLTGADLVLWVPSPTSPLALSPQTATVGIPCDGVNPAPEGASRVELGEGGDLAAEHPAGSRRSPWRWRPESPPARFGRCGRSTRDASCPLLPSARPARGRAEVKVRPYPFAGMGSGTHSWPATPM
jgi:hypothetical protein